MSGREESSGESVAHVGHGMAKGAAWMTLMRWSRRGLGMVNLLVLAWIVTPEDFGLVALAMPIYTLCEVFAEFGFDTVLIQKQKAGRAQYDTAWTMQVIRGFAIAGVLVVAAPFVAAAIGDPRLEAIYYALTLVAIADGFQNIGVVDFRKALRFDKEFLFLFLPRVAIVATSIPVAFLFFPNYWALLIGIAAGRVARLLLSYVMSPYRPRFTLVAWREIMDFSKWLMATNLLEWLNRKSDIFVIGKLVGVGAVGIYELGRELAQFATSELIAPISRAVFPGYAILGSDHGRLSWAFVNVTGVVLMLGVPLAAGVGLTGDLIIQVAFNENWLGAIEILRVLAIQGVIMACMGSAYMVFNAIGRPNISTYLSLARVAVLLPLLIWWTMSYGAIGAAWALVVTSAVRLTLNYVAMYRVINLSPLRLLRQVWRTALASATMAGAVLALRAMLGPLDGKSEQALALGLLVAVGAATYIGVHFAAWAASGFPPGPERHVLNFAQRLRKGAGFGEAR